MVDKIPHITCEHLLKLHKQKEKEHIVLDIRELAEFDTGHIIGALHVPHHELETNIDALLPDKVSKVVVIVGPTQESEIETIHQKLEKLGYKNVEFLAGGIDRWCEIAPLEVEPELLEQTPEEAGFVGDEDAVIDPEGQDNEPLF